MPPQAKCHLACAAEAREVPRPAEDKKPCGFSADNPRPGLPQRAKKSTGAALVHQKTLIFD